MSGYYDRNRQVPPPGRGQPIRRLSRRDRDPDDHDERHRHHEGGMTTTPATITDEVDGVRPESRADRARQPRARDVLPETAVEIGVCNSSDLPRRPALKTTVGRSYTEARTSKRSGRHCS